MHVWRRSRLADCERTAARRFYQGWIPSAHSHIKVHDFSKLGSQAETIEWQGPFFEDEKSTKHFSVENKGPSRFLSKREAICKVKK